MSSGSKKRMERVTGVSHPSPPAAVTGNERSAAENAFP